MPITETRTASLLAAARRGAFLGFKWATIIIGSVLAIILQVVVGLVMFTVLFRDGTRIDPGFRSNNLKLIAALVGAYVASAAWSSIIGATIAVTCEFLRGRNAAE